MRTTLGRVGSVPVARSSLDIITTGNLSTGTGLQVSFKDAVSAYHDILVHFYGIEKPSIPNGTPALHIQVDGSGFGSGLADWTICANSATSAITATGATGSVTLGLAPVASPFALATATSDRGGSAFILVHEPLGKLGGAFSWEWQWLNSASQPGMAAGHAYLSSTATGALTGLQLTFSIAGNMSAQAIVYGIGRRY